MRIRAEANYYYFSNLLSAPLGRPVKDGRLFCVHMLELKRGREYSVTSKL